MNPRNQSNNSLVKKLTEFGLREKEAATYLALIELEIATASQIAETSGINRSSTYVVLESLKKKGLVSFSEDKRVQRYIAVSPDMLFEKAIDQAKEAQEIKNKIEEIIPELKALHKDTKQKPKIRVFEGKQNLIHAFNDSLNNKEKFIRECSSSKNIFRLLPTNFSSYVQKRIDLNIKMNGIHPDDKTEEEISEMFPGIKKLDKSMFIPEKKYRFPADIMIYDEKICYLSPDKKGFAIIIESKEIADVMKNIFDLAHQQAKRIAKRSTCKK